MKLTGLTSIEHFVIALKACTTWYWACIREKQVVVADILIELQPQRKKDRKIDRWWHQYQNLRATVNDTKSATRHVLDAIHRVETNFGIDGGGPYLDREFIGGVLLALKEPLCDRCAAKPKLHIDFRSIVADEQERFWQLMDSYINNFRVTMAWRATMHRQLHAIPNSEAKTEMDLAYDKLEGRLKQATTCSTMIAEREFGSRGVPASWDSARMAYTLTNVPNVAHAELAPVDLCPVCESNRMLTPLHGKVALNQVLERRKNLPRR